MKAQVAMEYVIMIGILLFITIPIFYYALSQSGESTRISQAYDSVNAIANVADNVYALGPGNKREVWVNMPRGVTSTYLQDNTIKITLSIYGGNSDFVALTKANITTTSELPSDQGRYKMRIETLDSSLVKVSYTE